MAVAPEKLSGIYEEPDELSDADAGEREKEGHRLAAIMMGNIFKFEPLQEGVHRYPPVSVETERDADKIQRYINMPSNVILANRRPKTDEL